MDPPLDYADPETLGALLVPRPGRAVPGLVPRCPAPADRRQRHLGHARAVLRPAGRARALPASSPALLRQPRLMALTASGSSAPGSSRWAIRTPTSSATTWCRCSSRRSGWRSRRPGLGRAPRPRRGPGRDACVPRSRGSSLAAVLGLASCVVPLVAAAAATGATRSMPRPTRFGAQWLEAALAALAARCRGRLLVVLLHAAVVRPLGRGPPRRHRHRRRPRRRSTRASARAESGHRPLPARAPGLHRAPRPRPARPSRSATSSSPCPACPPPATLYRVLGSPRLRHLGTERAARAYDGARVQPVGRAVTPDVRRSGPIRARIAVPRPARAFPP